MSTYQLWLKHRRVATLVAREFFIPSFQFEDTEQEAMIALWEAAREFDPEQSSFPTWARFVIRRRLTECLRMETTKKATVLNKSIRVAAQDGELATVIDLLPHLHQVSDRCETREEVARLLRGITRLSDWEQRCVLGIASGLTYRQIGGNPKRIDNTLYKSRAKLRAAM